MPNIKEKACIICGTLYQPTGRCSKFCPICAKVQHKERQKEGQMRYREKLGKPTGVGKGGSNKKFTDHPSFLNGMGNFYALRKTMRETITHCQRCGKDLTNASQYEWCVHHIDRDRSHNTLDNLEMLCKRCHQMEHDCIQALRFTRKCNDQPVRV